MICVEYERVLRDHVWGIEMIFYREIDFLCRIIGEGMQYMIVKIFFVGLGEM
jgi:hypothetical protein